MFFGLMIFVFDWFIWRPAVLETSSSWHIFSISSMLRLNTIMSSDAKVLAYNFDLQGVLNTTKYQCGKIFYLTGCNTGNDKWDCCICQYVMANKTITAVKLISDGCVAQRSYVLQNRWIVRVTWTAMQLPILLAKVCRFLAVSSRT